MQRLPESPDKATRCKKQRGHIPLWRELEDSQLWKLASFAEIKLAIWLMLRARVQPTDLTPRGCVDVCHREIARRVGISRSKVAGMLAHLASSEIRFIELGRVPGEGFRAQSRLRILGFDKHRPVADPDTLREPGKCDPPRVPGPDTLRGPGPVPLRVPTIRKERGGKEERGAPVGPYRITGEEKYAGGEVTNW